MAFVLVGRDLAHYKLLQPLGSGAMSEVYLARDTRLEKEVAVKVILDSVARKPELVARFEREARAAGRLNHPHVTTVYFFGQTEDGAPFYAMELVDGWSLGDVIEARLRFRLDQALALLAQCCAGLQAALEAGIVHRDIKPANLMVGGDGVLKIVDFGLAKLSDDKSLTRSGTMLGTPYYMAPEVVRGDGGDYRADIYSLGVTFFHLLVGYPPYEADTPYGVMMKHINQPVPDLARENPRLPESITALVTSMLLKDPGGRPKSYKLIQAEAMRIAAELAPRDLMSRLAWCRHEARNTIDHGGRCASCQRPYAGEDRPARFHVDLVGWHRNGADEEVAAYIGKAVGRPPEVVAPLLQKLPFRAAFKAPRERARRMQKAFYAMGADVQLVPADDARSRSDAQIKELPFKAYWPPEPDGLPPDIASRPSTGKLDARALRSSRNRRLPSVGALIAIGFGLLSVALGAALLLERRGPAPSTSDTAQAPPEATPEPVVEAVAAPTPESSKPRSGWDGSFGEVPPPAEPAPAEPPPPPVVAPAAPGGDAAQPTPASAPAEAPLRSRRFEPELRPGASRVNAQGALAVLDDVADEIDRTLGLTPQSAAVRFTNRPLIDGRGARSWPSAVYAPVLEFPLGGAESPSDASFQPAARLLYGRAAIRRAGGASVPPWLLVGLSLVLEQGSPSAGSVLDLIQGGEGRPTALVVGIGANAASSEQILRSFAGWLVDAHGWPKIDRALQALQRTQSLEGSFVTAFGASPTELEQEWLATVTGGE